MTPTNTDEERGDNLLISNYDRWCTIGDRCVAVVYIYERYNYTRLAPGYGYSETVVVQGDRERLREAVRRALDYAREHKLMVQVNNPHVQEDIEAGILDTTGIAVVYDPIDLVRVRKAELVAALEAVEKEIEKLESEGV